MGAHLGPDHSTLADEQPVELVHALAIRVVLQLFVLKEWVYPSAGFASADSLLADAVGIRLLPKLESDLVFAAVEVRFITINISVPAVEDAWGSENLRGVEFLSLPGDFIDMLKGFPDLVGAISKGVTSPGINN